MTFDWGERTYVMGIMNVTPDSFSGDGMLSERDWLQAVMTQADIFVAARGGYSRYWRREHAARQHTGNGRRGAAAGCAGNCRLFAGNLIFPISMDTYRATVAEAALDAGANWVNDVWGLRMDESMAGLVAERGCPVVIMHNRSKPKDVAQETRLGGPICWSGI